jgi:hypothetical protein
MSNRARPTPADARMCCGRSSGSWAGRCPADYFLPARRHLSAALCQGLDGDGEHPVQWLAPGRRLARQIVRPSSSDTSTSGLKEPFSELAASVVRQKPDLIIAVTSRVVRALKLATTAIPIVGVMTDPVAWRIVESLSRPGGNITGVSSDAGIEIFGKQLELLIELLPQSSSVGYLGSRDIWESSSGVAPREAAQRMGVSLFGAILESAQEAEYRRVFAAMKQEGVAGILVGFEAENNTHR